MFFNIGASFIVSAVRENSLCCLLRIVPISVYYTSESVTLSEVFLGYSEKYREIFRPLKAEDVIGSKLIPLRKKASVWGKTGVEKLH